MQFPRLARLSFLLDVKVIKNALITMLVSMQYVKTLALRLIPVQQKLTAVLTIINLNVLVQKDGQAIPDINAFLVRP